MSVTFDEKDLDRAIDARKEKNDRNDLWIKGTVMNTMWNDPTFEHGETNRLLEILKQRVPDIFEDEKNMPGEKKIDDPALWNEDYFAELTYWFRENFALSRIKHIREVGKAVHKKSVEQTPESNDQKKETAKKVEEQKKKSKTGEVKNFHKPGMMIAAIILVILLVLLLKNLFK